MYHLKGCLKGEAADIIESLEISSDNYIVAWDLLQKRYDNRKVIREDHASALLKLPDIKGIFNPCTSRSITKACKSTSIVE